MKNKRGFLLYFIFAIFCFFSCRNEPQKGANNATEIKNEKFTVTTRFAAEPDLLNPLLARTGYARYVNYQIFYPLMGFDPTELKLKPLLVKSEPIINKIEEGKDKGNVTYTFELLEDAKWPNGSPVLASDYVFTFKAIFNPAVQAAHVRGAFDFLEDIQIDPNNKRKFTVITNKNYILIEAALGNTEVLPSYAYDPQNLLKDIPLKKMIEGKNLLEQFPNLQTFADAFGAAETSRDKNKIAGAGPYQLVEWITDERLVLKKKENWWGNKYPNLKAFPEKIVYKFIPDQTSAITLLKDQSIDAMTTISPTQFAALKEDDLVKKNYSFFTPPYLVYMYVGFNRQSPKLEDRKVRRAIAHLMDVDEIIKTVMNGTGQQIIGPFHPTQKYYNKDLPLIEYNVQKAKELLLKAGWKDSDGNGIVDKMIDGQLEEMSLSFKHGSGSATGADVALLFQKQAKRAGVNIEIKSLPYSSFLQDFKKRDFELIYSAWGKVPLPDDPFQIWHTDSDRPDGSNRVGFGNASSDALIEKIRQEFNPEVRNELYHEFQRIIYEDQPYIFILSPLERIVVHKRFEVNASALRPGIFENEFVLK